MIHSRPENSASGQTNLRVAGWNSAPKVKQQLIGSSQKNLGLTLSSDDWTLTSDKAAGFGKAMTMPILLTIIGIPCLARSR